MPAGDEWIKRLSQRGESQIHLAGDTGDDDYFTEQAMGRVTLRG